MTLNTFKKTQGFQTAFEAFFVVIFAAFWVHFILSITPGNYYSVDDVNFFAPLISEYLTTNDSSLWLKAQGPHLHFFYKFQTLVSMRYFGWSTHFTQTLGLVCLIIFGWAYRHKNPRLETYLDTQLITVRYKIYGQLLLVLFCNVVFLTILLGYVNKRSFEYHMLALNNPALLVLGAICLYNYAKILTNPKTLVSSAFLIFGITSFCIIWILATAFNYFILVAISVMFLVIIGPAVVKTLASNSKPKRKIEILIALLKDYVSAILSILYFAVLTLAYYIVASSSGVNGGAGNFSLSLKMFLDLAYSSTGLNGFPGFQQSDLISYSAFILIILATSLILLSKRLAVVEKLFFIGVITFIISFAIGSAWLRGEGVILAPRYIFSFSFFWMTVAWLLGKILLSNLNLDKNLKILPRVNGEKFTAFLIMSFMLFVGFSGMVKTGESVKFLKGYYKSRIHIALYTPLYEIDDDQLRASIFCNLPIEQCKTQILRMRCFANSLGGEFCSIGKQDDLIQALSDL